MDESPAERRKIHGRKALSAAAVHTALRSEGEEEIERPTAALAWSGLAAGLSMGLSLAAEGVLRRHLPDASWTPLVTKIGYSVGFITVTLGRQQLYTETTLTALLPWLNDRRASVAAHVIRLWGVVLAANLAGALLFAWAASSPYAFPPEIHDSFRKVGVAAMTHTNLDALVRGIFGGWMIALMVWLMPSAESARIWIIALITWLLAASQLTHIIAGSVEGLFVVITGDVHWTRFVFGYALPTLAGNTLGGVIFVAALNHAQVAAGKS